MMNPPEMTPLFRQQVLESQVSYLGGIRISRSRHHAYAAIIAWLLVIAAAILLVTGQVTRKAQVPGLLVPTLGMLQLTASSSGTLLERHVNEGAFVKAGAILFVIGIDRSTRQGDSAVLISRNLQQRQDALQSERELRRQHLQSQQQAFSNQLRTLERELTQATEEARLAERRANLSKKNVARYEQLVKDGFVSDQQAQGKNEELLDWQSRVQAALRAVSGVQREVLAVQREQSDAAAQLQNELSRIDREIASLAQEKTENETRHRLVVSAPQTGIVTTLHIPVGGAVQAGQALATLAPQTDRGLPIQLQADLYAPSRTAGFIQAGQEVWLRYAAFPYQKFGMSRGVISSVSRSPINAQDMPPGHVQALQQQAGTQEPRYRITVRLDRQHILAYGNLQPLSPGMTLDADVIQERRSLLEWAFEPIIAIKKRMSIQKSSV